MHSDANPQKYQTLVPAKNSHLKVNVFTCVPLKLKAYFTFLLCVWDDWSSTANVGGSEGSWWKDTGIAGFNVLALSFVVRTPSCIVCEHYNILGRNGNYVMVTCKSCDHGVTYPPWGWVPVRVIVSLLRTLVTTAIAILVLPSEPSTITSQVLKSEI